MYGNLKLAYGLEKQDALVQSIRAKLAFEELEVGDMLVH